MKKHLFLLASLMVLANSCQHVSLPTKENSKEITFQVTKQEKVSMRAALTEACNRLSYIRSTGNTPAVSIHQTSEQESFGIIKDELELGEHDLYFIGYNTEDACSIENGIVTFSKISDTFSFYTAITVNEETASTQNITMPRRVAKFELVATDKLPDNLSVMEVTITGGATALNAKTGRGEGMSVQTKTINVPESNIGKTNCTFASYAFLPEGVSSLDVSVKAKDAEGNIIVSHSFEEVEMQTNYITRYTGSFFDKSHETTISVDSEWDDTIENEY